MCLCPEHNHINCLLDVQCLLYVTLTLWEARQISLVYTVTLLCHNTFLLLIKNQRKKDDPPAPNILCLLRSIILTVSEFQKSTFTYLLLGQLFCQWIEAGFIPNNVRINKPSLATAMKCVNCYKAVYRLKELISSSIHGV